MYKKNIQCLTKTFLTLSLSDVASRVQLSGPAQAESYILNMVSFAFHIIKVDWLVSVSLFYFQITLQIEDGEIYAVINQKDGMVVFLDSPEKYASPETLCLLEKQMANCTRLHQHILEMDQQIQVNPQVIIRMNHIFLFLSSHSLILILIIFSILKNVLEVKTKNY